MVLKGPPRLVTERLDLRLPAVADLQPMRAIITHAQTRRYLGPYSDPADHFQRFSRNAGSWLLYGYGLFMIRPRGSGELIGNAGVFHSWRGLGADFDDQPEAGWIIAEDRAGRGYAREAMEAALGWFDREHGLPRTVCMIECANAPSIRLAGHLGFGPLRDALFGGAPVLLFERTSGSPAPAPIRSRD